MAAPGTPSVGATSFGVSATVAPGAPAAAGTRQYMIFTDTTNSETWTAGLGPADTGWTLRSSLNLTTPNGNVPDRGNTARVEVWEQDTPGTGATSWTKSGTRRFGAVRVSWPGVVGTPTFATATQSNDTTTHTTPTSTPPVGTDCKIVALAIVDQGPTPVTLTSPTSPWVDVVNTNMPTPQVSETQSLRLVEQEISASGSPSAVSAAFTTSAVEEAFLISWVLPGDVAAGGATYFMQEPLPDARLLVEAAFGADLTADDATWTWTDITGDVQQADAPIAVTVGRASEAAVSQPAQCEFRLDNRSGDYSIGGQSAHWPYIRRNTPIRVRVDPGTATYHVVFQGFADAWQPSWDITGRKATVSLSASGTLRRLQQNISPVTSSLRRAILDRTDIVAYWPCEEGKNAQSIASGLPTGTAMSISGDTEQPFPKFATNDDFGCSAPLPEVALTSWRGVVPRYTATGQAQVRWLMAAPELMHGTEGTILSLYTTGTIPRWDLTYVNANEGNLKLYAVDSAGVRTELVYVAFAVNSTVRQWQLALQQSGADIIWSIQSLPVGHTTGTNTVDFLAGETITAATAVTIAPNGDIDDTAIGHIAVHNAGVSMYSELEQLNANAGELVTDRLERLCAENATDITIVGTSDITMGAQGVEDLVTLLRQCETADQGLLYDGLGPGLTYITGSERINQAADLTLDVTAGHLVNELAPVDDDARNVNKVKAERLDGADATYEDVDGVLGTAAIGIYDDTIKANIELDENVIDYATWLVNLGTVDGYRYPQLHLNFAKTPELVPGWLATTLSSRVDVEGIDQVREQHPGGTATLLLEGYDMEIDQFQWTATLNCSPYEPWRVGEYAEETGDTGEYVLRASSDGSTLASGASAAATSLSVATPTGPLWTTTADDFPLNIDVGGIKVTVTAISGTSSPQTFTVTGATVTKALPSGLDVRLWQPPVLGL